MTSAVRYGFIQRRECPACLSTNVTVEYECPFDRGAVAAFLQRYYRLDPSLFGSTLYQLLLCRECSLFYQGWVGNTGLLAELYGEWINEANLPGNDPQYQMIMAHPLESRDAHEIIAAGSYLGLEPSTMRTLDYGMGWAMWARIARFLGCRSAGTELSPDRIAFARRHGVEVLRDEEIGREKFQFINTEQVFEHLSELRPTVDRLAAALVPGGVLKVSVPSGEHAGRVIAMLREGESVATDEEFMPVQPLEHVNSFTKESLRKLADSLGLRIVRPSLFDRYAFLGRRGSLSPLRPKNAAKELVRPFYQYMNRRNLYMWFQKPR